MHEQVGVGEFSPSYYISQLGDSLIIFGSFGFGAFRIIYAWALDFEDGIISSCNLLFTIPHPSVHFLKLLGLSNANEPIMEAEIVQQWYRALQVFHPIIEGFVNVHVEANQRKNEGTVTRIKTDEKGVFEMLFIALGASIRTFAIYLRPLLMIDATHLKGQYKGTNLIAVGMDGNNQIVPISFGICKGETGPWWSWWMSALKECIGDNSNLLFRSDRHAAIALAVQDEFLLAYHVVCCRHLMINLSLKRDKTKALLWKICKAYTTEEFSRSMSYLQDIQTDAYDKLCQVGLQRWSRAHCPLVRYNYLTSNSVESVNACIVVYMKLPVLKLTETYRAMVQ
nr:transposase, MuDR, MULE transposase domain protein [Tanacetum cinerariifolium]